MACEAGASIGENICQLRRAWTYRRQYGGPPEAALSAVQVSDRAGLIPRRGRCCGSAGTCCPGRSAA